MGASQGEEGVSGEVQQLLDLIDAPGRPGEWTGFCPVHEDRSGNRSLCVDVKAKESDYCEETAYPRLYIYCRSCGANGQDVAAVLGIAWENLEPDALAMELPLRRPRPWRLPSSIQLEQWVIDRRNDPEATRWLTEERLLTVEFLDRYRVGWDAERRRWIFPVLTTSDCFIDPVAIGCLWYPADPLSDGTRKMCNWRGGPPHLYPDVPDRPTILLVEGELDAAVGRSHDLPTVSGTIGARQWTERLTGHLRGKRVIVIYDCDDAGREGAADRVADLTSAGIPAEHLDLDPSRDDGFDLTDWFREGRTVAQLRTALTNSRALGDRPRAPLNAASRSRQNGRRREER